MNKWTRNDWLILIFLLFLGAALTFCLTGCTTNGGGEWHANISRKGMNFSVTRVHGSLSWDRLLETEQDRENQRLRAERRQTQRRMNSIEEIDRKKTVPTVEE